MHAMIRYKLKPEEVESNLALLAELYAELNEQRPTGLRDATYQLEDQVSFVHFVSTEERGPGPLPGFEAFRAFRDSLEQRCVEPPVLVELFDVGSFGFD